jgi:hypothetical protein
MTFLPIVERELRVRSGRAATYWTRFVVALAGGLVCMVMAGVAGGFSLAGQHMFDGLLTFGFLLCCCACLLTGDSISSERREGTLGLLFLTRVKGYDVLLGKLSSAALAGFCALVAFLPVLMIPVLAGGVTGGEAVRSGLVLLNTMFFALAAGLCVSAGGSDSSRTAAAALLLVALFVLAPVVLEAISGMPALLSPLFAMRHADAINYRTSPSPYWISQALVHGISWLFVLAAHIRLRSAWRDTGGEQATPSAETDHEQPRRNKWKPDGRPIEFLVRRQRGIKGALWITAVLLVAFSSWPVFLGSASYWLFFLASFVGAAVFAWAASRFFIEARRTGELELLLTTPLGANTIVSGQWSALRLLFVGPMILLSLAIIARFIAYYYLWPFLGPAPYISHLVFLALLAIATTLVGIAACCWLGMWFGLRTGTAAGAVLRTVAFYKVVPYVLFGLIWSAILATVLRPAMTNWSAALFYTWLPQLATLLFYLWLIRWAKRRLTTHLAGGHASDVTFRASVFTTGRRIASAIRHARHWTPG